MSSYKIVLETEREMDAAATFLWWRLLLSIAPEVSHENPYCGLQFTLTLHNVIDVDTFIWHTTMCLIMTLLSWDVHYQVAAFASPAATAPSSAHFHFQ